MASVSFHHGTRVFQSAETPVLVRTARTAVIGLIGTAEEADAAKFPLNKPVMILQPQDADGLGSDGTLAEAIDSIFDQVGCPIVMVRVEEGATAPETWANMVGDQTAFSGVHAFRRAVSDGLYKPKLLIAPGFTQTSPADGIASIAVTAGGTGYVDATTVVAISGTGGAGAEAKAVIEAGVITSILVTKPGYGFTGTITVTITGAGTGATATATKGATINPVVAELMGVADSLKAIAYVDGPDTTDQAAVQYRGRINSGRIFVCDPKVLKFDTELAVNVPQPSSPIWAARQARMDLEQGFWWAGSNVEVAGIVGINRPIEYGGQSNYLNENRVNTIVNINNTGFRLWGVWTCDSDLLWQFVSVRRTADAINEALEAAYIEFVDRPFTKANLKFLIEAGRAYLRTMELEGAILPGSDVWLLDSNTNEELAQGIVKLGVKFEPPTPMVDVRITSHRNLAAYELLLDQVAQEMSSGSLAA
ncbi:phage tail sheath subtilisin-like domain-containing protein [Kaistia nematophila]|uniref:Phage tail sheath subtilisin-like domain-containing protein n=1 Tax=Kaistia nematophila TaxID=2994654 RepID=A0A9X3IME9_9HYPH|nr:phage tail sheath subtilisin-like domain-containing protein [Kaistia nematophila]MCX5571488.1 phage tail sheath subtilisin-like domain-containing protein [Kaistia nematophila]